MLNLLTVKTVNSCVTMGSNNLSSKVSGSYFINGEYFKFLPVRK